MIGPWGWMICAFIVCAVAPIMVALNEMVVLPELVNWTVLGTYVVCLVFCLVMATRGLPGK